jgi:4-hydroxy-3-methylbut-2-enyl diphosphate reductase
LRSHGVSPTVIACAIDRGLTVVDATCPHVSKAQQAARELKSQGYTVVVVGEQGHPEVEAIRDWAGEGTIIVQVPSDLPDSIIHNVDKNKIGIVVQTTQTPQALQAIVANLEANAITPVVRNTICSATRLRQQAAWELAGEVDVMLVVGGRNSGNTTRLQEICSEVCSKTYHIEVPDELDAKWFAGANKIGVTAGASTPQEQIEAVVKRLGQMG